MESSWEGESSPRSCPLYLTSPAWTSRSRKFLWRRQPSPITPVHRRSHWCHQMRASRASWAIRRRQCIWTWLATKYTTSTRHHRSTMIWVRLARRRQWCKDWPRNNSSCFRRLISDLLGTAPNPSCHSSFSMLSRLSRWPTSTWTLISTPQSTSISMASRALASSQERLQVSLT